MDIDERKRFELKSRMLALDLNTDRLKVTQAQCAIRESGQRIASLASEFHKLKAGLAQSGVPKTKHEIYESLIRAKATQHKIADLKSHLTKLKDGHANLERKRIQVSNQLGATEMKSKWVDERMRAARVEREKRGTARDDEESIEVLIQSDYDQPTEILFVPQSNDTSNSADSNIPREGHQRQTFNFQESTDQRNQSESQAQPRGAGAFEAVLEQSSNIELSNIRSWEGLRGTGVSFGVHTKSGRDLNVTIISVGDKHVKVNLQASCEIDRRVLWGEKQEIALALEAQGYIVQEISVRGGTP